MKHGNQYKITTTITEKDMRTIKRSKYTYADAIRYFADRLRETGQVITKEDLDEMEDERGRLKVRITELEVELERAKRRYQGLTQKIQEARSMHPSAPEDPDLDRAVQFIRERVKGDCRDDFEMLMYRKRHEIREKIKNSV